MKIIFTMSDGKAYELSHEVYGGSAPLTSVQDAQVQVNMIIKNLAYFGSDDGTMLMVPQIVTAKIVR